MKNHKILIFIVSHFLLVTTTCANEGNGGALQHLKDAIKLNQTRAPLYAQLSNGKSLIISEKLIAAEKKTLFSARLLQILSYPYRAYGIGIGELEFISMGLAPKFSENYNFSPELLSSYKSPNSVEMEHQLRQSLKISFYEVSREVEKQLLKIKTPKAYNCMTRHLLESILRTSNLAYYHMNKAKDLGIASPEWLSKMMIKSQIKEIDYTVNLDKLAAPIQSMNIPIICNDVPVISPNL